VRGEDGEIIRTDWIVSDQPLDSSGWVSGEPVKSTGSEPVKSTAYKKTKKEDQKTSVATAPGAIQEPLPSMPAVAKPAKDEKVPTINQRANTLACGYYERLGRMGNVPAFAKIIKKALERDYADEHVARVLTYLAEKRWSLTEERLANNLRGGPRPATGPAPKDPTKPDNRPRTANGMLIQGV
jgi:hypothetical protein